TSLKTSIKTITYLSDIGCLEIQGASLCPNCSLAHEQLSESTITDPKKMKYKRRSTGEEKVQKITAGHEGNYRMESVATRNN
ncbi:hypothetical protein GT306_004856, partial [Salmonella enterica subsp. enterica serovar Kentucky]|nr:hypothetical protein [Salmonella enterica subsp. enterica serovar Kentucky]